MFLVELIVSVGIFLSAFRFGRTRSSHGLTPSLAISTAVLLLLLLFNAFRKKKNSRRGKKAEKIRSNKKQNHLTNLNPGIEIMISKTSDPQKNKSDQRRLVAFSKVWLKAPAKLKLCKPPDGGLPATTGAFRGKWSGLWLVGLVRLPPGYTGRWRV